MSHYSKLSKLLQGAGLSDPEILVYIELLKNPAENKWELVLRTNLAKTTVYRACEKLEKLKLIIEKEGLIVPLSLKSLVAELNNRGRKNHKLASKIKSIAPFLSTPADWIEEFETYYTKDQITDAYLFMSETDYHVNLDFGDFENFVPTLKDSSAIFKFRHNRVRHANHHAICTTFGENTAHFCTKESEKLFKNKVDRLNIDFRGRFIIFSDNSNYVLFNMFSDPEETYSVLVKSKAIADAQRMQFNAFSQSVGN
jgi:sugar-specific transcriptional regulator TrmB